MNAYFIKEQDFNDFLSKLIEVKNVIGPVAKKSRFVFTKLNNREDLRLDYDVTILPPKKEFFPTTQTLLKFDGNKYDGCIEQEEKILLGVHFYDIKAIDMTDQLFEENNKDMYYLAQRKATTIIGSNVQNVSKRAFWGTVGKDVKAKGHDGFLTKIDKQFFGSAGYVYQTFNEKGEALLQYGNFEKASDKQMEKAKKINEEIMDKCPEKLNYDSKEIGKKVRATFNNQEMWSGLAEDCFSCGSCNTTCPTCYCFDVQDKWNLNQTSGYRNRYWDACLTEDFAKVSLGAGAEENFRDTRGERFRHRVMRKAAYLNEKLGGPACVGCGRCSAACTADIADPVNVINKIMEV